MSRKPRVFIASSVESLPIADAINQNLDHQSEVTIWRNGTFDLSNTTIDSLLQKTTFVDYAIFIFSPDDLSVIRNKEEKIVRDNIVFELGLFIGKIGKERCYIVKPRSIDLHLPSDLLSLTTADYEPNRSDGDLASALNYACTLIKKEILRLGLLVVSDSMKINKQAVDLTEAKMNDVDLKILAILLTSFTETPSGFGMWTIKDSFDLKEKYLVDISSIKLERMGFIQKENDSDYNGQEFYSYKISQDGVDYLLKNETQIFNLLETPRKTVIQNPIDMDNLPF